MVGQGSVAGQLAERTWSLAETKKRASRWSKSRPDLVEFLPFLPFYFFRPDYPLVKLRNYVFKSQRNAKQKSKKCKTKVKEMQNKSQRNAKQKSKKCFRLCQKYVLMVGH